MQLNSICVSFSISLFLQTAQNPERRGGERRGEKRRRGEEERGERKEKEKERREERKGKEKRGEEWRGGQKRGGQKRGEEKRGGEGRRGKEKGREWRLLTKTVIDLVPITHFLLKRSKAQRAEQLLVLRGPLTLQGWTSGLARSFP